MDAHQKRPPPMVIDVYLDTGQMTQNQSLVAIDDDNKRWDVEQALQHVAGSASDPPSEVICERWTVSLEDSGSVPTSQLADAAANVYKKGVVMLKSLFTYSHFLPAWKFTRRTTRQANNGPSPKPRYRITTGSSSNRRPDTLECPLSRDQGPVTEQYHFASLPCALGALKISVKYRVNCNFEIETAERLLSEQFAPAAGTAGSSTRISSSTSGELASDSRHKPWARMPSSTGEGSDDLLLRRPQEHRTSSASKSSLRSDTIPSSMPRRPSVSFQPFKAGSLSSSPASGVQAPGSPSSSLGRTVGMTLPSHNRSRSSLNALPQQALRTPGLPNETAIGSSASSSPRPTPVQRFSSSFGNRRARFPSNAGSKTEDENNNNSGSSRGSVSSAQRASVTFPEAEGGSHDDSESIGDFLKMLDKSSKGLPSFNKTDQASLDAQSQRTSAQYSRFSKMRDSTAQPSDSMSSSLMLQRSSSSSSRQFTNMPGLMGGVSASSSPGKPVSPHTPHIPAIPSRLSNNSIVDYTREERRSHFRASSATANDSIEEDEGRHSNRRRNERGTTAIDIPASPRTFSSSRRSSSVQFQGRASGHGDDDALPFGLRSASLPPEDRASFAIEDDEPLLFAMGELGSQRRSE